MGTLTPEFWLPELWRLVAFTASTHIASLDAPDFWRREAVGPFDAGSKFGRQSFRRQRSQASKEMNPKCMPRVAFLYEPHFLSLHALEKFESPAS